MEIPTLQDVVIIFGLSVLVLILCHRFRIPTIVGYFVTGILSGPHGFGLINDIVQVDNLAALGIMLLLFTIGIEFSLKRLIEIRRFFFIGGLLQVGLTSAISFALAQYLQRPVGESLFLGFLISMSSTAIVLKALEHRDETDTLQGNLSLGILIFQDILAVPMMLLLPILSHESNGFDFPFLLLLLKGCLVVALVFFAAVKLVPQLLYYIAKVRSRELFLLSILLICFSVAWLSSSMGLSLSIGAFLAGLIISESPYSREALSSLIPLRDLFASFFFVSIGMLLDINFILQQPFTILGITALVLLMKGVVVALAAFLLGMPLRIMIIAGLTLSQIGEFSFVLAHSGIQYKLATDYHYQLFFSVALLTMAVSPSLIHFSGHIAKWIEKLNLPLILKEGFLHYPMEKRRKEVRDHIIIVGFGPNGQNLAKVAKESAIPYLIVEMNPETVRRETKKGEPILYGDATHEEVLRYLNIGQAQGMAVVINDQQAAKLIVELSRRLNPNIYLVVRTRYMLDRRLMMSLGADAVIADEFGSSLEIMKHMLERCQVAHPKIDQMVSRLQEENYQYN
jgi:CPA2 family monovalent cation:H+ antiporter-2